MLSYNLANYYCPENKDYYIISNYNSEVFQSIILYISRWDNDSNKNWESSTDIDDFIDNHVIDLQIIYSYFDFDDFDAPVKTYLSDYDVSNLNQTMDAKLWIIIRINICNLFKLNQISSYLMFQTQSLN